VKACFKALVSLTKKGEVVSIQGLGSFDVTERKATTARNPQTGAKLAVPKQNRMRFQPSKTLKDDLNGGPSAARSSPIMENGKPVMASKRVAAAPVAATG